MNIKKSKEDRRKEIQEIYNKISLAYPIFNLESPKPLDLKIIKDISVELNISRTLCNKFLHWYIGRTEYLKSYRNENYLYNQNGDKVSLISEEIKSRRENQLKIIEEKLLKMKTTEASTT
jgi:hypothetical protein